MKQVLHIFRKDTRRFRIEILLSIIVLTNYALRYPIGWQAPVFFGTRIYMFALQGMDKLIVFLIPVVWLVLITRVIQAEAPTGDRQWWVTRPYQWKSLLAAKALFLLMWLYVPAVLSQMIVLHRAGLAPQGHISHWLFFLLFVSGCVVFPLIDIASVTSNFARMMLTLLGAAVAFVIFFSWMSANAAAYWPMVVYPRHGYIYAVILLGGAAAIALQYATRSTWLARALMTGVAVAAAVAGLTLTTMRQDEVDREFPASNAASATPVQVTFRSYDPNKPPDYSDRVLIYQAQRNGMMNVELPLEFSGVAEGSAVEIEDAKFSMDAADGRHWNSPWSAIYNLQYISGTYHPGLAIMIPLEQYQEFKSRPITMRLTLAVTELHVAHETSVPFTTNDFKVDGFGVCSSVRQMYGIHTLICRSEAGQVPLMHIATTFWRYPCGDAQAHPPITVAGYAWAGRAYADQLDSAWDPIALNLVQPELHSSDGQLTGTHNRTLCPGTPVQFTQYAVTRRTQVSLAIPNFQLPEERR